MKIMVFLHGTTIMHRTAVGRTRAERVQQVRQREASIHDYAAYVPVGNAARKVQTWAAQGAEIVYLSSHRDPADVEQDRSVLQARGFPAGAVSFRNQDESYTDVVARVLPDMLIEDDCESIGGEGEMTYPQLPPALQRRIKSIIVQEFGGIDHLPDDLTALGTC